MRKSHRMLPRGLVRTARSGVVVGVAGCAVAGPIGAVAANAAPISCGQVITSSVVLSSDLHCAGTSGLFVGASGVTIDLAGHSITGGGTGRGVAIVGPSPRTYTDVTVKNGTISGFGTGVSIDNAESTRLSQLRLVHDGGTSPHSAALFMAIRARGVQFDHSVIQNSGTAAIVVYNGAGLAVSESRISGGGFLFVTSIAGGNTITGSRLVDVPIHSGQSNDIVMANTLVRSPVDFQNSSQITIKDNRFRDADTALVVGSGTMSTQVTGNTFTHNKVGVRLQPAPMGTLAEVKDTHITSNTFSFNGAAGTWMEGKGGAPAGSITVTGNLFRSNGHNSGGLLDRFGNTVDDGLHIDAPGATGVMVTANHTDHNADFGIEIQPGTAIDGGGNTSHHDPHGCLGVACS